MIVIGGGVTGAGTARDCALRGLSVLLLEQAVYNHGASGRNHGLMHSGGRYAVTDPDSARECAQENAVLRHIACHCVEATDGLFVTLDEDDLDFQQTFVNACRQTGIKAEVISPSLALMLEPSLNHAIKGAVRVPDAAIDPFALTQANLLDAVMHGATVRMHHQVTDLLVTNGRVKGVKALDRRTGTTVEFRAAVTINAAGIWGSDLMARAGVTIKMFPAKGTILIFAQRLNHMVLNRCRRPANGDIIVPDGAVSMLGTTSDRIDMRDIDNLRATSEEVRQLMQQGEMMVPKLAQTRLLRAFAGVRPLIAADDDPSGRSISRGIVLIDHDERDGMQGIITITGGKLITYRKMAEQATDLVCCKLGVNAPCTTADTPLPGSESGKSARDVFSPSHRSSASKRHGTQAAAIPDSDPLDRTIVCECENVSVGEIKYAIEQLGAKSMSELMRRTRLGMGRCQGKNCACRVAEVLARVAGDAHQAQAYLQQLIDERWKGIRPVAWGATMREAQLTAAIYQGLCGLDKAVEVRKEVDEP